MRHTDQLWQDNLPLYQAILNLPFNRELTAGTLAQERFAFYVKQDALYLADFSRALAQAATRADDNRQMHDLLGFATEAVAVEQALHEGFLRRFDTHIDVDASPTCLAYTSFLLSTTALEEFAVGVAALLPCFWIYREVGLHIHARASADNPFRDWIDTYAGEDFSRSVDRAIEITDQAAEKATEATRESMRQVFERSTRLEWMFWDSAYRQEQWRPVIGV